MQEQRTRDAAGLLGPKTMYERLYPTKGRKPVEELHKLLTETRVRHDRFKVTLGSPPFERDLRDKIVGIRLRFTPAALA